MIKTIAFICIFTLGGILRAETVMELDQALKLAFPEAVTFTSRSITLNAKVLQAYEAKGPKSAGLGLAVVAEELGKHQPITFLIAMDSKGAVRRVELLKYRERYGSGIRARHFMQQFEGKTTKDSLVVGKDIDAVSGATISSKSIALGVRKVLRQTSLSKTRDEEKQQ